MADIKTLNIDLKLKRIEMEMEDGNFSVAADYVREIMAEILPDSPEMWWLLLKCMVGVANDEALVASDQDIRAFAEYTKAVRLARGKLKTAYKQMGEDNFNGRVERLEETIRRSARTGDTAAAYDAALKLANIFPKESERWWTALMYRCGARNERELINSLTDMSLCEEYECALRYAEESVAEEYRDVARRQRRKFISQMEKTGEERLAAKDFAGAKDCYEKLVNAVPEDAEFRWQLLKANLNASTDEDLISTEGDLAAREDFTKILELADKKDAEYYYSIARRQIQSYVSRFEADAEVLLQRGAWQAAEDSINNILNNISPHTGSTWWLLLKTYCKCRTDEALLTYGSDFTTLIEYVRAIRYSEDDRAAYYTEIGRKNREFRIQKLNADARNYIANGNFHRAKQAISELVAMFPEEAEYRWLALLCRCRVRAEEDLLHYDGDFSQTEEYREAVRLARIAEEAAATEATAEAQPQAEATEATEATEPTLEAQPQTETTAQTQAQTDETPAVPQENGAEEAVTVKPTQKLSERYESILLAQRAQKSDRLAEADEARSAGLFEQAAEIYTKLIKGAPEDSQLWWRLLECKFGIKDDAEFTHCYSDFSATREFKNALKFAGEEQLAYYNSILESQAKEEESLAEECEKRLAAGEFEAAEDGYFKLLSRYPKNGEYWWRLLKAKCNVREDEGLVLYREDFSLMDEFKKAVRYSGVQLSEYYRSFIEKQKRARMARVEEIRQDIKEYQKLVEYKMFAQKNKVKDGVLLLYKGDATVLDFPLESLFTRKKKVKVPRENAPKGKGSPGELIIPIGIVDIKGKSTRKGYQSAFKHPELLKRVVLPESLSGVGAGAFAGCSSLREVILPPSVQTIGEYAFSDCSSLTEVLIPLSVKSVEEGAFRGCTSLTEIILPSSVIRVGKNALEGCRSLKRFVASECATQMQEGIFQGCTALEEVAASARVMHDIPQAVKQNLRTADIVSGVTIWESEFKNCVNLREIKLAESIHQISGAAFEGCTNVEKIVIHAGVNSMGARVFAGWTESQTIYVKGGRAQTTGSAWNANWAQDCRAKIIYQ